MSGPRRVPGPVQHVVVIGAGFAGLSAALHLRGRGLDVTLVEAQNTPGGRVRTENIDGALFDTGASVLTMPSLIAESLAAVGVSRDSADALLDLTPLDPTYHLRFADGVQFALPRDPDELSAAVGRTFGPAAEDGQRRLRRWLARLYDVEFDRFIARNTDGLLDYVRDPELRDGVVEMTRMGAVRRLTPSINRFVTDARLRRAYTFQALYAGVPPTRAPAIYAVIAHMDVGLGVYYPRGGMGRVGAVLAQALTDAGGTIRYRAPAERVLVENRSDGAARARAVRVGGPDGDHEEIDCDAVVVTTDTPVTDRLLADAGLHSSRWRLRRRVRHSPSAVVAHLRVPREASREWPGGHHTIDFGAAWDRTFVELTATRAQLMSDPSLLINRPGVTDPDHFAVDGLESVSVLAPCPNLDGANLPWDVLAGPYVAETLSVLARRGFRGIDTHARIHRIDHPGVWAASGMSAGTPFAAAHTLTQTGPLRRPNLWPGAANVVLAGSSTVPGVGIPPVLVSGMLAADRITG